MIEKSIIVIDSKEGIHYNKSGTGSEDVVKDAAHTSDLAIIILGRTAGEDKDNSAAEGSYLLTEKEEAMLEVVCRFFPRVAVILTLPD